MTARDRILQLIEAAKPSPAPVRTSSNLYIDLGFDSMAFMKLILTIEETFSIRFELIEIGECLLVERLIGHVTQKTQEYST